jgi:hypothetical protein
MDIQERNKALNTTKNNDMLEVYKYICSFAPLVGEEHINNNDYVELLLTCQCTQRFRIYVKGNNLTSAKEMDVLSCPRCGIPANKWVALYRHSGGCFNGGFIR